MSVVINGCGSRVVRRDWQCVLVHGLVVEKEGNEGCFVASTGDLAGNHPNCGGEREGGAHFFFSLFSLFSLFCFFALFLLLLNFCLLVFLYMFFLSLWFSLWSLSVFSFFFHVNSS